MAGKYELAIMASQSPKWAQGLTANNLNFEGIVDGDMLENILELHKRDTVSTFGTRSSRRVTRKDENSDIAKVCDMTEIHKHNV